MEERPTTRFLGPNVAGVWYPSDRDALRSELDTLIDRHGTDDTEAHTPGILDPVVALVVPHAGFQYSGATAAAAFGRLQDTLYDRVILIGPSHYQAFSGAAVPSADLYRTPLGDVPIDTDAVFRLGVHDGIRVDDSPFLREHSLEAEIPFLQRGLPPHWKLIPVLLGGGSTGHSNREVADALAPLLGPETLVVVSSDFTHYGPRFNFVPFDKEIPERIKSLDNGAIERILACDGDGFDEYVKRTGATICGRNAIDVLLRMLPAGCRTNLEYYEASGKLTGDWTHSVSYAGLVFRLPENPL